MLRGVMPQPPASACASSRWLTPSGRSFMTPRLESHAARRPRISGWYAWAMSDLIDLDGRTVIVTGASSGIGASTARQLRAAGAHPVLAARRADRLGGLSDELGGALAVPTDVTDPAQVQALVDAAVDRHGRVDGLVNNAGASFHGTLDEVDLAAYRELLQLNVVSVVGAIQAVLPVMRRQGGGRIVNI